MKHRPKKTIVAILALFILALTACDTEFFNPNNPTEDVIFESKDGLFNLDEDFYDKSGGILKSSEHYLSLFNE